MNKKLIVLIIMIIILPFNIYAKTYGYIAGNEINEENLIFEDDKSGSVIYDEGFNSLTFNNYSYENTSYEENSFINLFNKNGSIELIGDNYLKITSDTLENIIYLGTKDKTKDTTFTINGSGTLTIEITSNSFNLNYINVLSNKLLIEDSNINIIINNNDNYELNIIKTNYLDINKSNININLYNGDISKIYGINSSKDISIDNSNINISLGKNTKSNNIINIYSKKNINTTSSTIKLINYNESNNTLYKSNNFIYDNEELISKDFKYMNNKTSEVLNINDIEITNIIKGYYIYIPSYNYNKVCKTCNIDNNTNSYSLSIEGNYHNFKSLTIDNICYTKSVDYNIINNDIIFTKEGINKLSNLSNGVHKVYIDYSNNKETTIDLTINKNIDNKDPLISSLATASMTLIGIMIISVYFFKKYY